jgi:hypothetical protein
MDKSAKSLNPGIKGCCVIPGKLTRIRHKKSRLKKERETTDYTDYTDYTND